MFVLFFLGTQVEVPWCKGIAQLTFFQKILVLYSNNYFSYRVQRGSTFFLGLQDKLKDVVMETECQPALALHQALPPSLGLRIKTFLVPLVNVTTPLHPERANEAR